MALKLWDRNDGFELSNADVGDGADVCSQLGANDSAESCSQTERNHQPLEDHMKRRTQVRACLQQLAWHKVVLIV